MYARLAAFEGGDSEGMRKLAEQQMAAEAPFPEAVRRAVVLGSPDGERRLFITFFEDEEALAASEEDFEKMGDAISEGVRGRRVAVERYEVLVDWSA